MTRNFKITSDENQDWFNDSNRRFSDGYISYRQTICHALHYNLINRFLKDEDLGKLLSHCLESWKNNADFNHSTFIDIAFGNSSISIADHSKGTFPLILNSNERKYAFKKALNDISNHFDEIILLLSRFKNWCLELEEALDKIFSFKS